MVGLGGNVSVVGHSLFNSVSFRFLTGARGVVDETLGQENVRVQHVSFAGAFVVDMFAAELAHVLFAVGAIAECVVLFTFRTEHAALVVVARRQTVQVGVALLAQVNGTHGGLAGETTNEHFLLFANVTIHDLAYDLVP